MHIVALQALHAYDQSSYLFCATTLAALATGLCRLLATGHASHASRTAAEWRTEFLATLSSGQKLAALQLPGPSNGVVQCYVKRISGLLGVRDTFEVRLEASDQLLAVARRRKKSATSSYLISMGSDAGSVTREDEQLVGKVGGTGQGSGECRF